ncbi:hypothetical protein KKG81_10050 [bacterium]|jgi:voltage-gated sodium channel|nr:hypothetical protein [bacterium]
MINLVVAIIINALAILNQKEEEHILKEAHPNEIHINEKINKLLFYLIYFL